MLKERIKQLAEANATPAYIFDTDILRKKAEQIREIGPKIRLCYAMKANPFLLQPLDDLADNFEVCSMGELRICKAAELDMNKVVLSGVVKEKDDIVLALEWGVRTYTVESPQQLEYISECVKAAGTSVNVLLRLTSGNQFGMDRETVERIIERRSE